MAAGASSGAAAAANQTGKDDDCLSYHSSDEDLEDVGEGHIVDLESDDELMQADTQLEENMASFTRSEIEEASKAAGNGDMDDTGI